METSLETFGLVDDRDTDLFASIESIEMSRELEGWLARFAPIAVGINTEMARSTYIIAPVLIEAIRQTNSPANVLPGVGFDMDRSLGLSGFCDYLITRSAEYSFVKASVIAVVEAKREDLNAGLGQCAAEMVAIWMFNDRAKSSTPAVYGCVTTGASGDF